MDFLNNFYNNYLRGHIYNSGTSRKYWIVSFILSAILIYCFCFIEGFPYRLDWYEEPRSFFYDDNKNFMAGVGEYIEVLLLWVGFSNHLYRLILEIRRAFTSVPYPTWNDPIVIKRINTDKPIVDTKTMFATYFFFLCMMVLYGEHWLKIGMGLGLIGFITTPINYVDKWVN